MRVWFDRECQMVVREEFMTRLRLGLLFLSLIAVTGGRPAPVQAQFHGGPGFGGGNGFGAPGMGFGGPGFGFGYGLGYSGMNASGPNSFNNWYVSPYRTISPGFVGTGGAGFGYTRNYGSMGAMYGYGLPVYNPMVVNPNPNVVQPQVMQPQLSQQQQLQSQPLDQQQLQQAQQQVAAKVPVSNPSGGTIKLSCPKTTAAPLTYTLNGNPYTIQPGYSQSFRDDRVWILEFRRGDEQSEVVRYTLKPGNYNFGVGSIGWELRQMVPIASDALPPPPLPDVSTPTPTPVPPQ